LRIRFGERLIGRRQKTVSQNDFQFLQYPDEELISFLEGMRGSLKDLPASGAKSACLNFLEHLDHTSLLRLQEAFTETFDLNPSTCLNLTYHRWGDGKDRSGALICLKRLYEEAGFEMATEELPDYLPLVLEFMTGIPNGDSAWIKKEFGGTVCDLSRRLQEKGSPFAGLFAVIEEIFRAGE
jgi:nitrate reductase molybdenum cofactor assembly chaperone NarJ/NarW